MSNHWLPVLSEWPPVLVILVYSGWWNGLLLLGYCYDDALDSWLLDQSWAATMLARPVRSWNMFVPGAVLKFIFRSLFTQHAENSLWPWLHVNFVQVLQFPINWTDVNTGTTCKFPSQMTPPFSGLQRRISSLSAEFMESWHKHTCNNLPYKRAGLLKELEYIVPCTYIHINTHLSVSC